MSKITNDGLTRLAQDALYLYPYGNSGHRKVFTLLSSPTKQSKPCFLLERWNSPKSRVLGKVW